MKPAAFAYHAPEAVEEAIRLLGEVEDSKVLAGGQSLVPLLNMRLAQPTALVDLSRIRELEYIAVEDGSLRVGAMTRQRALELHDGVARVAPVFAHVLAEVGHVTTRNRGTVGGSIAHADPSAQLPMVAVALDALLVIAGPGGRRTVEARHFFKSYYTTVIEQDEILVEIQFPILPPETGYAFEAVSRRRGDFGLCSALALVRLDGAGVVVEEARIVVSAGNPTPLRIADAERAVVGSLLTAASIEAAVAGVGAALGGTAGEGADYRRSISEVVARRAIEKATERARALTT